jgi:hypothetical protein
MSFPPVQLRIPSTKKINQHGLKLTMTLLQGFVALAAFALDGCAAAYQAPDLPIEQTAVLAAPKPGGLRELSVLSVDEKPLSTWSLNPRRANAAVRLEPGKHAVKVRFASDIREGFTTLRLIAEPGKVYLLRCESEVYKFRCWIEDKESGQPVRGSAGSGSEPGR